MSNNNFQIHFALQLEGSILAELNVQLNKCPDSQKPVITELVNYQSKVIMILEKLNQTNPRPMSNADFQITPAETSWQKVVDDYSAAITDAESAKHYIPLWVATTAFDHSATFYRQFAANTANPAIRMALTSISELKKLASIRAESALRVCINQTWKQIGFCPFSWN